MTGIAVGNLLGIPQEGCTREMVRQDYPDGVRDIEAWAGQVDDDDLAQAIAVAQAAAVGPLDPTDLGRASQAGLDQLDIDGESMG